MKAEVTPKIRKTKPDIGNEDLKLISFVKLKSPLIEAKVANV